MNFNELEKRGISFFENPRGWIGDNNRDQLAMDAALITLPNNNIPVELGAFFDPVAIDILTAPLKARAVFGSEVRKGDWTTPYIKIRINEMTGSVQPYSDFANAGEANTNNNWISRENFLYQTNIHYGDLEIAISSVAKIGLASDKQKAAANILEVETNRFYLFGVSGKQNYGFLNDPSLAAPISPLVPSGGSAPWAGKTTVQRYNDILALFGNLVGKTEGWVDATTPLKLCVSPSLSVLLGTATDFNVSVLDMVKKYFSNIEIVTIPELFNQSTSEQTMIMVADNVKGQRVGELCCSELLKANAVIRELSSYAQKWVAGTYGCVIYLPVGIASMRGM